MLSRLRIKNFQAHTKLDVRFDDVTVFVGQSDAGKSAILRAIKWALLNKPNGQDFVTFGEDTCIVKLKLDGNTLVRERASENVYKLNDKEFKAFGSQPPDDVAAVANVDVLLNFQDQHDASFWFSESAGEVGRRLNAIVNLEVVDKVLSSAANRARQAKQENEVLRKQYEAATDDVDRLCSVPAMVKQWARIDSTRTKVERLNEGIAFLVDLIQEADAMATRAAELLQTVNCWQGVEKAYTKATSLDDSVQRLKSLGKTISDAQKKAGLAIPDLSPLEARRSALQLKQQELAWLRKLVADSKSEAASVAQLSQDLVKAEKQLAATVKEKTCPTCGQTLK